MKIVPIVLAVSQCVPLILALSCSSESSPSSNDGSDVPSGGGGASGSATGGESGLSSGGNHWEAGGAGGTAAGGTGAGGASSGGNGSGGLGGEQGIPEDFDLERYEEATSRQSLSYVPADLSGITYNPDSNSFFMIRNNATRIWEIDLSYQLIRTMTPTSSFGDTEDIVYLGNDEYAIVTEEGNLYIGTIPPGEMDLTIDPHEFQKIRFAPDNAGNSGPEGVAFDSKTQTFYVVKEENPRKLYRFARPNASATNVTPTEPFDAETTPMPRLMQDMSGVLFNPVTDRLLILSHRDHRVVDLDLEGAVFGVLDLPSGQHEGIMFDNQGRLHIVAEPNFYTVYEAP